MKEYTLRTEVWLPRPRTEVFSFFADARNLGEITPPWLQFEILTPEPSPLEVGLLIDYRIRLNRLPIRWQTKIVEWNRHIGLWISKPEDPTLVGSTRIFSKSMMEEPCASTSFSTVRGEVV